MYHFRFDPSWDEGCKSCSLLADTFEGGSLHLPARDASFVAVSRAKAAKIEAFKKRMGWSFLWASSFESDFNYDFQAAHTKEEWESGFVEYNFRALDVRPPESEEANQALAEWAEATNRAQLARHLDDALPTKAWTSDEKAAERLVTANLRFVISYVKKYQGHGLDLSELVAIGNEGLLKAVKKFDPDQGVKFISYAVWWVRQAVLKALAEQTRSVRIPLNQNSQLIRMSRTETYLSQELGREPTDNEIAQALEDSVENVRTARRMTAAELSLDAPVDRTDKDAATLGERFAGQEGGEIEERTDGKLMREFIDRIFQKYLTPRERKILFLYYGLEEGSEAMTLEKIGALMGVTRERIRQIRERAFEKLRESPDGKALKGFWRAA